MNKPAVRWRCNEGVWMVWFGSDRRYFMAVPFSRTDAGSIVESAVLGKR